MWSGLCKNADMKIPYFATVRCHPRAGGDPSQLYEMKQFLLDSPLRGNDAVCVETVCPHIQ